MSVCVAKKQRRSSGWTQQPCSPDCSPATAVGFLASIVPLAAGGGEECAGTEGGEVLSSLEEQYHSWVCET